MDLEIFLCEFNNNIKHMLLSVPSLTGIHQIWYQNSIVYYKPLFLILNGNLHSEERWNPWLIAQSLRHLDRKFANMYRRKLLYSRRIFFFTYSYCWDNIMHLTVIPWVVLLYFVQWSFLSIPNIKYSENELVRFRIR